MASTDLQPVALFAAKPLLPEHLDGSQQQHSVSACLRGSRWRLPPLLLFLLALLSQSLAARPPEAQDDAKQPGGLAPHDCDEESNVQRVTVAPEAAVKSMRPQDSEEGQTYRTAVLGAAKDMPDPAHRQDEHDAGDEQEQEEEAYRTHISNSDQSQEQEEDEDEEEEEDQAEEQDDEEEEETDRKLPAHSDGSTTSASEEPHHRHLPPPQEDEEHRKWSQPEAEKHPTAFGPAPAGQDRAVSVAARGPGGIVVEHVEGKGQDSDGLPFLYVMFGPDSRTIARTIVGSQQPCPSITNGVSSVQAKLRFGGNAAFPIRVCEADMPAETLGAVPSGAATQSPPSKQHTIVIGDTGVDILPDCQCLTEGSLYNVPACSKASTSCGLHGFSNETSARGTEMSMLAELAVVAARKMPDLVIHTGGYVHRHTPCAWKLPGCPEALVENAAAWGDTWLAWKEDFFEPAKPLSEVAPWIFIRGDQEGCSEHWLGWTIFLDPRPLQQDSKVNASGCPPPNPTYSVRLSRTRDQFLVMDDSIIPPEAPNFAPGIGGNCTAELAPGSGPEIMDRNLESDTPLHVIDAQVDHFVREFQAVSAHVREETERAAILLSHRPLLAVTCRNQKLVQLDWTLQRAYQRMPSALEGVMLLVGGHLRLFELLDFRAQNLTQLLVGNTGHVASVGVPEGELAGHSKVLDHAITSGRVDAVQGFTTLTSVGQSLNIRAMQMLPSTAPRAIFRLTLRRTEFQSALHTQ